VDGGDGRIFRFRRGADYELEHRDSMDDSARPA
jgi:hypothetical protein